MIKLNKLTILTQNINSCFVVRLLRRVALVLLSQATSQSSIYLNLLLTKLIFYAVFIKKINRDNNPAPLLPLERIGNYTFSISSFDNPVIFEIDSKVGI